MSRPRATARSPRYPGVLPFLGALSICLTACRAPEPAAPAQAQVQPVSEGVLLRVTAKPGDELHYRMESEVVVTLDGGARETKRMAMNMRIQERLLRVEGPNQVWKMTLAGTQTSESSSGEKSEDPLEGETEGSYDRSGNLVEIGTEGVKATRAEVGNTSNIAYPERPVRPGDEWTVDQKAPNGSPVVTRYRFEGQAAGQPPGTYLITGAIEPGAIVQSTRRMRALIEGSTGKALSIEGGHVASIGGVEARVTYKITRITAADR
jgi:hypothetical protein